MILVLMPLVQILLLGFALSIEVRSVKFALLDFANEINTQKIIPHLSQNPHFILQENLITQDFGSDFSYAFKRSDMDLLLIFPPEFSTTRQIRAKLCARTSRDCANANLCDDNYHFYRA